MSDKDSFYYLNAYQDGLTPGQQVTIQHRISFNDWRAGPHIAPWWGWQEKKSCGARKPASHWKRICMPS